jgi:ADP-ribose pyrophosphatase YjhB (NUDIX family)
MMEEDRFCTRCSAPLETKEIQGRPRPSCPSCGKVVYHDPKVAATVVVEQGGRVLMVRRAIQPGMGLWSLPGGYVDRGEVVERAAAREVLEETGLQVNITGLIGIFSEEGQPVVLAAFDSGTEEGEALAGPEVSEVGFFELEGLPPLAFSRDNQILEAWQNLRNSRRDTSMEVGSFISEALTRQHDSLLQEVQDLTPEELAWRPGPEANPIGWVLWHVIRVEDMWLQFFAQRKLELWESQGWHVKFNLPARDNGFGHTPEQVGDFPALDLTELLAYFAQVRTSTLDYLQGLSPEQLEERPRENRPEMTVGSMFRQILGEVYQHLGHIAYLKGLLRSRGQQE